MGRDKNGMGNRGLEELTCATQGHELRGRGDAGGLRAGRRRDKWGKFRKTVIAYSIKKYLKKYVEVHHASKNFFLRKRVGLRLAKDLK